MTRPSLLALMTLGMVSATANAQTLWGRVEKGVVYFAEGESHTASGGAGETLGGLTARCGRTPLDLTATSEGARSARLIYGFVVCCVYSQSAQGESLSVFYPKAAASLKDASTDARAPFEIRVQVQGETLLARVWAKGKPVAGSSVELQWPEGAKETGKTDAQGFARFPWKQDTTGLVGLKATRTVTGATSYGGKTYAPTLQQATLTFPASGGALAGGDLENKDGLLRSR